MSIDLTNTTAETTLAVELGVSLDRMRRAREELLEEGVHFHRWQRTIYLTPDGVHLLTGLDFEPKKKEGGGVRIVVAALGKGNVRFLRGRVVTSGEICSVRLTGRGTKASQFRVGDELDCTLSEERADLYHFEGKALKRARL